MCCNVLSNGGRALGVSDLDYSSVCDAEYNVLGAEPLMYLIRIIHGRVCCYVLCVGGRALGVSDQDYPSECAAVYCATTQCVEGIALGVSDQDYPSMFDVVYCVFGAEPLVYLIKIIQACVLLCTMCLGKSPWCV